MPTNRGLLTAMILGSILGLSGIIAAVLTGHMAAAPGLLIYLIATPLSLYNYFFGPERRRGLKVYLYGWGFITTIGVAMLVDVSVRIPSEIKYTIVFGIAVWLTYMAWLTIKNFPSLQPNLPASTRWWILGFAGLIGIAIVWALAGVR